MKLKKFIIFLYFLILSYTLFSSPSDLYSRDSDEYQNTLKLCRLSGVLGPSSFTPISGRELKLALNRVNRSYLDKRYQDLYDSLLKELKDDNSFSYDIGLELSPIFNFLLDHQETKRDNFFILFEDERPFLNGKVKFTFGNTAVIKADLNMMNNYTYDGVLGVPFSSFEFLLGYYNGSFHTILNNPMILEPCFPTLALGSVGGEWINLSLGRGRKGAGEGFTGNLLIGDNYLYQEFLELTLFSPIVTYSIDFTHFDPQDELGFIQTPRFSSKMPLRLMHRLDIVFYDKVRAVLNMGFLNYTDNAMDLRYLFPLMAVHSWFNFDESINIKEGDESNNIMGFEVEASPFNRFFISGQFVVDQARMIWEGDAVPSAFGLLINASYIKTFKKFDATIKGEFVYTFPNLYLNEKVDEKGYNYNYDWALGYYQLYSPGLIRWAGYEIGPDAIVAYFSTLFDFFDINLLLEPSLKYICQGETELNDNYIKEKELTPWGIGENTISIECSALWKQSKCLELFGGVYLGFQWNSNHILGAFKFIPQAQIGLKYIAF